MRIVVHRALLIVLVANVVHSDSVSLCDRDQGANVKCRRSSESYDCPDYTKENYQEKWKSDHLFTKQKLKSMKNLNDRNETNSIGTINIRRRIDSHPFTIAVEGNIGIGKSTFVRQFLSDNRTLVLLESVARWRNVSGVDLVGKRLAEGRPYDFLFNAYAALTTLQHHDQVTDRPTKIMERSIYGYPGIFEYDVRRGILNETERYVLERWLDWGGERTDIDVDLIVYLRGSPETAVQRSIGRVAHERARQYISLHDRRVFHEILEDWLVRKTFSFVPAPVLILDAERDADSVYDEFSRHIVATSPLTSLDADNNASENEGNRRRSRDQMNQPPQSPTIQNDDASSKINIRRRNGCHSFTVSFEGNIGAGKSTLMRRFLDDNDTSVIMEPINLWRNVSGANLLCEVSKDPMGFSYLMFTFSSLTILREHDLWIPQPTKFLERSIDSGRYFRDVTYQIGGLSNASRSVMDELLEWSLKKTDANVDLIVYLRTDPETAFARMFIRDRGNPSHDLGQIRMMHDRLEEWLVERSLYPVRAPVIILDAEQVAESIYRDFVKHIV